MRPTRIHVLFVGFCLAITHWPALGVLDGPLSADGAWRYAVDLETKAHFRHSESSRFPVDFPFPPELLPPDPEPVFLETVDPGSHVEVSVFTLYTNITHGDDFQAHAKVDVIDKHDRNPTSGDRKVDLDQAWLRYGQVTPPATLANGQGGYIKIGKFDKLERQNDRHLESYGVVSTAFNRFEDLGVEFGADLGRYFYVRGSITQGNPLFFRDPNALAGDNGTIEFLQPGVEPEFNTGFPIIYDAEVEGFNFDNGPEFGAAAGFRYADAAGRNAVDVMIYGYLRELEETRELEGTFYGGDLDFLRGPFNEFPVPGLQGDDKEEIGANLRLYLGGFSLFGQFVDQEVASLPRSGFEVEAAYSFELPLIWAFRGRQLFSAIQPAVRFSRLDNDFANPPVTPFVSQAWNWEKLDLGVRIAIFPGMDLTAEFANNRVITAGGALSNDEWLVTFRWRL